MKRWIVEFADNGWLDWICPHCKRTVWNDDIHVGLDWIYCPYCGEKVIEDDSQKMHVSI